MRKIFTIFLVSVILFIFSSVSKAQIHISLGPQLGLALPMSDYSGNVNDFYNGTKYGMKNGFNIGATVKADLMVIAGRLDVNYAFFSNDGGISGFNNSNVTLKQHTLIIGIGPEFGINIPLSPIRPYASIELLFSTIGGDFQFTGTPLVNSSSNTISSVTRTGLGFLAGTEVKFGIYALDLSLRYNMLNLLGKSFSSYNNNDRTNAYLNLNDDKDPNYALDKHPIGASRTISTLQINVGFMIGF